MISAAQPAARKPAPWTWVVLAITLIAIAAAWCLLPLGEWLDLFERWIIGLGAWGVALGVPITLVTATIAASLAFLIARHFARDWVRLLFERRRVFSVIDDAVAEDGWKIVALLRLSPAVPFNLQNYLFGVTAISFRHFVAATFVGIVPGTMLYVYLGLFGKATASEGGSGRTLKSAVFGLGLLAAVIVVVLVTRKAMAKLKRSSIDQAR